MWGHMFLILGQQSKSLAPTESAVLIQLKKECVEKGWVGGRQELRPRGSRGLSTRAKNTRTSGSQSPLTGPLFREQLVLCTPLSLVSTAPKVPLPPCLSLACEGPGRVNHWAVLITQNKISCQSRKHFHRVDRIIMKHSISLVSDNIEEIEGRHQASVSSQGSPTPSTLWRDTRTVCHTQ